MPLISSHKRVILAVLVTTTASSYGATPATWLGTAGLWSSNSNWSINKVPVGPTNDEYIPSGVVTISGFLASGNNFSLSSGATLFVSASPSNSSGLSTSGAISNAGLISLDAGNMTGPNGFSSTLYGQGTLTNSGTITMSNPYNSPSYSFLYGFTTINNSGTINANAAHSVDVSGGLGSNVILNNSGTINLNGGGNSSFISGVLNNTGQVIVGAGLSMSSRVVVQSIAQNSGLLDATASPLALQVTAFNYNGGTILGSPVISGTLTIASTLPASFVFISSDESIIGNISVGQTVRLSAYSPVNVSVNSAFLNAGTLIFDSGTPNSTSYTSTLTSSLFSSSGPGDRSLTNTGVITLANAAGNTLKFTSISNSGTFNFNAGTLYASGQYLPFYNSGNVNINEKISFVSTGGSIPFVNSGVLTITAGTSATSIHSALFGNFTQNAGTLDFSAANTAVAFSNLQYNGGTILGNAGIINGTLTLASTQAATFIFYAGATSSNTLVGNIPSSQSIHVAGDDGNNVLSLGQAFVNSGTIFLENHGTFSYSTSLSFSTLSNSGVIYLSNPHNSGATPYFHGSSITNSGIIALNSGTTVFSPLTMFSNTGTVLINESAQLNAGGSTINNSGLVAIAPGSSASSVNRVNFPVFNQNAGTLDLSAANISYSFQSLNFNGGVVLGIVNVAGTLNLASSTPGNFVFSTHYGNTLSGTIAPQQSVHITSFNSDDAAASVSSPFKNNGTLTFDTTATSNFGFLSSHLDCPNGTLINSGTVVLANKYNGSGLAYFNGFLSIYNTGNFSVQGSATFAQATFNNAGTVSITPASPPTQLPYVSFNTLVQTDGTLTQTASTLNIYILTQSGGQILLGGTQTVYGITTLNLTGGSLTLNADAHKILVCQSLGLHGSLDLTTNDLLQHSSISQINQDYTALTTALANHNLTSSFASLSLTTAPTTLALLKGSDYLSLNGAAALFDGQGVSSTDLLVKYTLAGDVNLDGHISTDDYLAIDSGFQSNTSPSYATGDFNGDGTIDAADYQLIDAAFLYQGGTQSNAILQISAHAAIFGPSYLDAFPALTIPEPASISLLSVISPALLCLRRAKPGRTH